MARSLAIFALGCVSSLSIANAFVLQSIDASYVNASAVGVLRMKLSVMSSELSPVVEARGEEGKRQNALPLVGRERGNFYVVDLKIGIPPQTVQLAIDTGSSDTWVNPTCSTGTEPGTCQTFPRYDVGLSTTARNTGATMDIYYGIGHTSGIYYTDNMMLGGAKIISQRFGISTSSQSMNIGLMGVGLGNGLGTNYANLIDQLALQGLTQSRAFSLDLASISSAEGSIIFGGIDTAKYSGSLTKLSMIPYNRAPDGFPRYWINMESVAVTLPGQTRSTSFFSGTQAVFLDSGGTLSQLPISIVGPIAAALGATSIGSGYYRVDCGLLTAKGSVDFGFGGTNPLVIRVPYSDFIWQAGLSFCYLGLAALSDGDTTFVLGDTFLRSAFVVYDVDNFKLHLAPATNCGTNLVVIGSGVDAVPSAVGCGGASSSSVAASKPTSSSFSSSKLATTTAISSSSKASSVSFSSQLSLSSTAVPTSKSNLSTTAVLSSTSKLSSIQMSSSSSATPESSSILSMSVVFSTKVPSTSSISSTRVTSISSKAFLSSSTTSKVSSKSSTASLKATTTSPAPIILKCSKDSCLRQMTNAKNQVAAREFCASYMSAPVALPKYLNSCKAVPSVVTSACRCAAT